MGNLTGLEQVTHLWKASSSVTHGESGGPVLSIEGGRLRLVGLIVGDTRRETDDLVEFDHYVDLRASLFISSFEVLNRLDVKKLLDEDKRSYVKDNPAELRLRV